jgi:hypothetical protein
MRDNPFFQIVQDVFQIVPVAHQRFDGKGRHPDPPPFFPQSVRRTIRCFVPANDGWDQLY